MRQGFWGVLMPIIPTAFACDIDSGYQAGALIFRCHACGRCHDSGNPLILTLDKGSTIVTYVRSTASTSVPAISPGTSW